MLVFCLYVCLPICWPDDKPRVQSTGKFVQVASQTSDPPHHQDLTIDLNAQGGGGVFHQTTVSGSQPWLLGRRYFHVGDVRNHVGDVKSRVTPAAVFPIYRCPQTRAPHIVRDVVVEPAEGDRRTWPRWELRGFEAVQKRLQGSALRVLRDVSHLLSHALLALLGVPGNDSGPGQL